MSEGAFVPYYPPRPAARLSAPAVIWRARRNLLAIWHDRCFEYRFFETRLLNRTVFVCNDPELVRELFIDGHDNFERKSAQMRHALAPLIGDGLFISDGHTWRERRRVVAPIVHASKVAQFAPVMVQAAAETAERWQGLDEIDALPEMARLTAEVICRTIFGRRLGIAHAAEIVDGFREYQQKVGQIDLVSLLGLPEWLPRIHGAAVARAARRIQRIVEAIIEENRGDGGPEQSLVAALLGAVDETGRGLSVHSVRNEAVTLFMAGHETTGNTLAWAWYLLSQAPSVEARLHDELDRALGGRLPTVDDLPNLPWTRAIIDETLRLYPPVPLLTRQAAREFRVRGRTLPAGALLMAVPWLLHRHRRFWYEPDAFLPERFLPEHAAHRHRYAYIPFSIGPRICAGMAFAVTEAVLALATLASRYRLRLRPGARVEPVCRLSLRPHPGVPMLVEKRPVEGAAPAASAA